MRLSMLGMLLALSLTGQQALSYLKLNILSFHWVLVVLEPRKMIVHYLDPMHQKPCEDLKDIVNMALRISAKKTSKREPSWQLVQCPRQGRFKCGYFVMRFIKEIIFYPTIIASKVLLI
ncbi:hypothetical protein CK203_064204 [Vitis vinifera]|uniref:Ubiquitin-like protease family profile domain-containing protein n=1 Tax=Vitis vinifera TaxID=29760 RepID=A0A438G6W3_VITVI|nr:hypothetical protein CK203_064204 [Vitis vinifera]